MEFIATVNRGGYRPSGDQINEWRLRPEAKPKRRGNLISPEVPGTPDRRVWRGGAGTEKLFNPLAGLQGELQRNLAFIASQTSFLAKIGGVDKALLRPGALGFGGYYETIPGRPAKEAVYGPDKPPEKFLRHLRRLGWIERDSKNRYGVTLLGHALLKADTADETEDASPVMVLAADDELAYGRVLGAISQCQNAIVVDGYLSAEALMHILANTSASRFLINNKMNKGRVTELAIQINLASPSFEGFIPELRRADFHDRYLVGEDKLYMLTSSLNGVGKSTAVLVEVTDVASQAIRQEVNDLWDRGEVTARGLDPDVNGDLGELGVEESDPDADFVVVIQEEDCFRHGGCTVRHRSREAAMRCRKG